MQPIFMLVQWSMGGGVRRIVLGNVQRKIP